MKLIKLKSHTDEDVYFNLGHISSLRVSNGTHHDVVYVELNNGVEYEVKNSMNEVLDLIAKVAGEPLGKESKPIRDNPY